MWRLPSGISNSWTVAKTTHIVIDGKRTCNDRPRSIFICNTVIANGSQFAISFDSSDGNMFRIMFSLTFASIQYSSSDLGLELLRRERKLHYSNHTHAISNLALIASWHIRWTKFYTEISKSLLPERVWKILVQDEVMKLSEVENSNIKRLESWIIKPPHWRWRVLIFWRAFVNNTNWTLWKWFNKNKSIVGLKSVGAHSFAG